MHIDLNRRVCIPHREARVFQIRARQLLVKGLTLVKRPAGHSAGLFLRAAGGEEQDFLLNVSKSPLRRLRLSFRERSVTTTARESRRAAVPGRDAGDGGAAFWSLIAIIK